MDVAERRALIFIASKEPNGVYADPKLSNWCQLLKALEDKTFIAKVADGRVNPGEFYRLRPNGWSAMWLEAEALEYRAMAVLGKIYTNGWATPSLEQYDNLLEEVRELRAAHASIEWGEFGFRKREEER